MSVTRDEIVDAALTHASQTSWESLRLHDIAALLGASLNDLRVHFREKEEIVDAWFDRADAAMLERAEHEDVRSRPGRERLERVMMAWYDALAPHRRVTRQMIGNRLEPGHIHFQFGGLMRVSRTVQWMREAAGRDATLPRRAVEETVLTGIYLLTFAYWMYDDSPDSVRTREFLHRRLAAASGWARWVPGKASRAPT